jgi:putative transcriptional regulator
VARHADAGQTDPVKTPRDCSGKLLVAPPQMGDPNFAKTVVAVLVHNDEGAFGLVLNRSANAPGFVDSLSETLRSVVAIPLLVGGPVEPSAVIGLAEPFRDAEPLHYAELCNAPTRLGTIDLESEPSSGLRRVRLFAGYSGWGPLQLDGELALDAWLVVDAEPDDLFTDDVAGLWGRVLRRHASTDLARRMPDDPSLN